MEVKVLGKKEIEKSGGLYAGDGRDPKGIISRKEKNI